VTFRRVLYLYKQLLNIYCVVLIIYSRERKGKNITLNRYRRDIRGCNKAGRNSFICVSYKAAWRTSNVYKIDGSYSYNRQDCLKFRPSIISILPPPSLYFISLPFPFFPVLFFVPVKRSSRLLSEYIFFTKWYSSIANHTAL